MSYSISPITEAGEHLIGAAEILIETFRARLGAADRTNEIDLENYRDMQRVGNTAAFVPKELGGFGLQSIHDWTLTIAALARGMAWLQLPSVCTFRQLGDWLRCIIGASPAPRCIQEPNKSLKRLPGEKCSCALQRRSGARPIFTL